MLTSNAMADRKWRGMPELRKRYENVSVDWWDGGNSNPYGCIERLTDHLEISRALLENPTLSEGMEPETLYREIGIIRSALADHVSMLSEANERLKQMQHR